MSSSSKLEWLKTGSVVLGALVAAGKAVIEYRKYKRDQESAVYTRDLQRRAWEQVMNGELSEAKIGDFQVKAPSRQKKKEVTGKPVADSDETNTTCAAGVDEKNVASTDECGDHET